MSGPPLSLCGFMLAEHVGNDIAQFAQRVQFAFAHAQIWVAVSLHDAAQHVTIATTVAREGEKRTPFFGSKRSF